MIQITKNLFGQYRVAYPCPKCGEGLRSPLTEAGKPDTCPNCSTAFIVPGTEDLQRITAEREANAQHKRELAEQKAGARVREREAEAIAREQRYQDQLGQQKEQASTRAQKMEAEGLAQQKDDMIGAGVAELQVDARNVVKLLGFCVAVFAGVLFLMALSSDCDCDLTETQKRIEEQRREYDRQDREYELYKDLKELKRLSEEN